MLGNQLHFLAMSQGLCRKQKLFTQKGRAELAALPLRLWASRRREELLKLLAQPNRRLRSWIARCGKKRIAGKMRCCS